MPRNLNAGTISALHTLLDDLPNPGEPLRANQIVAALQKLLDNDLYAMGESGQTWTWNLAGVSLASGYAIPVGFVAYVRTAGRVAYVVRSGVECYSNAGARESKSGLDLVAEVYDPFSSHSLDIDGNVENVALPGLNGLLRTFLRNTGSGTVSFDNVSCYLTLKEGA